MATNNLHQSSLNDNTSHPLLPTRKVTDVETHCRMPDRSRIVDPASLAEYCQRLEAHLAKTRANVEGWQSDPDCLFGAFLQNEFYALLDTLAALLVILDEKKLIKHTADMLQVESPLDIAQCSQPDYSYPTPNERQEYIDEFLWGVAPPAMSQALRRFVIIRDALGKNIFATDFEETIQNWTCIFGGDE